MLTETGSSNRQAPATNGIALGPLWKTGRTLLVLGRASNLPTVWSNCLAGWWLGEGGASWRFLVLCLGATFLYAGGMYVNDACDVEFDRQHRLERPIPSGAISLSQVWGLGVLWLALGILLLSSFGMATFILGLLLVGLILLYDSVHKMITFSPVLMAGCRFFLYLVAASAASPRLDGLAIWSGLALGAYIVGLSFIARKESTRGPLAYWPLLFLAAPLLLASLIDTGRYRIPAGLLGLLFLIWVVSCLRCSFLTARPNVGRTVSGLLAGICWVDWLAVLDISTPANLLFVIFFFSSLIFQRFIPAT